MGIWAASRLGDSEVEWLGYRTGTSEVAGSSHTQTTSLRAFRKRFLNRRNFKTPALRFCVNGEHFENGSFKKTMKSQQSCDFPAWFFLKHKPKMNRDCYVFIQLSVNRVLINTSCTPTSYVHLSWVLNNINRHIWYEDTWNMWRRISMGPPS